MIGDGLIGIFVSYLFVKEVWMEIWNSLKALPFIVFVLGVGFYSPSDAQIVATASLNVERRGHTATQLSDGKILVVGGENSTGPVQNHH